MATEVAQAYVQIIPSAKGIKNSLTKTLGGEASSAGSSAGESLGSSLVGKLKGIIVAAGIGTVIKDAISAGADVEQSFGGLDTIYGSAAESAKKYAIEAAQAGISMNDYAENAVSFGASLKQAFEGDTAKAVEAANTAILDMTDNAAKMGTPIENIQNAYQGFAKQNYTMLDNLKLGYGGTKTEMERLLADAEKLSGKKYDIGNLGDVYDAIHVIQGELGLTGVAAEEASTTLSGSLNAMKSSFTNLLATITTGGDISTAFATLSGTVFAFVQNNLIPMLGKILQSLPEMIVSTLSMAVRLINATLSNNPDIVSSGIQIIADLITGVISELPYVIEAIVNLATQIGSALINYDWIGLANDMISELGDGLALAGEEIFGVEGGNLLEYLKTSILDALPGMLEVAVNIINNIVTGILNYLPTLLEVGGEMIVSLLDGLLSALPMVLTAAADIVMNLFNGIVNNLPQIIVGAVRIITSLVTTFAKHYPEILQTGIEIIGKVVAGLIRAIPKIIAAIPQIVSGIKDTMMQTDWVQLGKDIIAGIIRGIKAAGGEIINAVKEIAGDALKGAVGAITGGGDNGGKTTSGGSSSGGGGATRNASANNNVQNALTNNNMRNNAIASNRLAEEQMKTNNLLESFMSKQTNTNVSISLEGDAKGLFNAVRKENDKMVRSTGYHALA